MDITTHQRLCGHLDQWWDCYFSIRSAVAQWFPVRTSDANADTELDQIRSLERMTVILFTNAQRLGVDMKPLSDLASEYSALWYERRNPKFIYDAIPNLERIETRARICVSQISDLLLDKTREENARLASIMQGLNTRIVPAKSATSIAAIPALSGNENRPTDCMTRSATPKPTLAAELGVKAWRELEAKCTVDGLNWKRKGVPGRGQMWDWAKLGVNEETDKRRELIMELAKAGGSIVRTDARVRQSASKRISKSPTIEEQKTNASISAKLKKAANAHRSLVARLNAALCQAVGLKEIPIANVGGHKTLSAFQIAWCDDEPKPERGMVTNEEDDKWSPNYSGPE